MSKKGSLTFLHQVSTKNIKNGEKVIHEEEVVHGDRGLKFKYYHKEGDHIEKVTGVQKADGSFVIITVLGDKKDTQELSKEDTIKMLAKHKHLKFALDYIKAMKGGKPVPRKPSRSASRKGSDKGVKKDSKKKGSKKLAGGKRAPSKSSKKGSKKTPKNSSIKASKKTSQKSPKKASKKGSRTGRK